MLRVISLKDGSYNTLTDRNGIHDRPDLCTEVKNPYPERIELLSRKGPLFPVARVFWIHAMAADNFTLHEMHESGNCYKIRLTAALIGTKLDLIEYNTLKGETRTQDYLLNINPNGRIPVLQIGGNTFLPESGAACYYLASGNDAGTKQRKLIPDDRLEHAQMLQWMFFEQYSHEPAIAVLRFWRTMIGVDKLTDLQQLQIPGKEKQAREVLDVMEGHLRGRDWFVGDAVTLADVVLFAYTHCLAGTELKLADWKEVEAWVERVKMLDGFVSLQD